MKKIAFESLISTLWKNGQGKTRQVLSYPESADLNNFIWRVSMAEIQHEGAFSNYLNVSRSLTVLSGELTLNIDGNTYDLLALKQIIRFDGAAKSEVIRCKAPVLDFGVMTNNIEATHTLRYYSYISKGYYERLADSTLFCLMTEWPIIVTVNDVDVALTQYDCLYLSKEDSSTFNVKVAQAGKSIQLLIAEFSNVVG